MSELTEKVAKLISQGRSGNVPDRETAARVIEMVRKEMGK